MNPIIGVYTSKASDTQKPQFNDEYYALAYADLFKEIIERGGRPVVVYEAEKNYLRNGNFRSGWFAKIKDHEIIYEKSVGNFGIDLLYDKNRFPYSDLKKINPDYIREVCNDKYVSYLFAPEYHATSFLIEDDTQLDMFLMSHRDNTVVLKELDGSGGTSVYVGKADNYDKSLKLPLLAQEFIDTSGGVRGLASGIHDIRIGIFNGDPIMGYLRVPHGDELRSNQFLGGTGTALLVHEIPKELVELTKDLDRRFNINESRFFAADWGFDKNTQTWKLFEINGAPGLEHESEDGPAANEFLRLLAEKLIGSATS